jgi:hypothetical protein
MAKNAWKKVFDDTYLHNVLFHTQIRSMGLQVACKNSRARSFSYEVHRGAKLAAEVEPLKGNPVGISGGSQTIIELQKIDKWKNNLAIFGLKESDDPGSDQTRVEFAQDYHWWER